LRAFGERERARGLRLGTNPYRGTRCLRAPTPLHPAAMQRLSVWLLAHRLHLAAVVAVGCFAVLVGRFWHPAFGFTKFLQIDETDRVAGIHELRENPIYFYPGQNGYDGAAYAQIAFHPLLDSSELKGAIDNVPYRARRILGSALAWTLAGGAEARIADVYAELNLGVWLVLAMVLWRLLPVSDVRSWFAWAGFLFSAGALHAVRLALTDLLAVTLLAAAMLFAERGRSRGALGILAVAGLARETAIVNVVALWRGPSTSLRAWAGNFVRGILVALPLIAWMLYVRAKAGAAPQGIGNFTWPLVGFIEKWGATFSNYAREPQFAWLNTTTLLATIALTVQAAFILRKPRGQDIWWRVALTGVAMLTCFGTAVWEGHPGAATRVVLPMSLAFAVLVVRERASLAWLVAGNLSLFSGMLALWHVPAGPEEFAAGRFDGGAYVARLGEGWLGRENAKGHVWSWTSQRGELMLKTWQLTPRLLHVRLSARALGPREMEIRQGNTVLWRGKVGTKRETIEFDGVRGGDNRLEFRTAAPPVPEGNMPDARALGFAIYDVSVE
jgi:hypothetical protein